MAGEGKKDIEGADFGAWQRTIPDVGGDECKDDQRRAIYTSQWVT